MATTNETPWRSDGQEEEISLLRNHFKDDIRILSSIGQFSYILKIRADQYDVSLTLQLDQSYPSKPPEIMITAPRLTPDQILLVQQLLQSYSETLLHQPMVSPIYTRLLQWFNENNIQALSLNSNSNSNTNTNTPSIPAAPRSPTLAKLPSPFAFVSNQNKVPPATELDHEHTRKCSTRTVDEVIARIESDARLDKRHVRVGYLDRLLGLQEKPFYELDLRVDLSSAVDERPVNILVIPKHLIQYFTYANEIIWDKERRSDLMFGSSLSQQSIDDVIDRHKNLLDINRSALIPHDVDHTLSTKRFLTLADGLHKPNYFLSIPITDPSLITHYIAYREHLLSSDPLLLSSSSSHILSCDPRQLHVTLLTLRLASTLQLEQCIIALKRIHEEIRYHCSYPDRIRLKFDGINTFYGKSLYVRCQSNARLDNLRTLIIERLCEQQQKQKMNDIFFAGNYQEFIPHIILFKSKRKLSPLLESEGKEIYFGQQTIDALQLSSIDTNENDQQRSQCVLKLDLT